MNYGEFMENVVKSIPDYLPEEYRDASVSVSQVQKINSPLQDAIIIRKPDDNIAATIYPEKFYEEYQRGVSLEEILRQIADAGKQADIGGNRNRLEEMARDIQEFDRMQDEIFVYACNYGYNRDGLQDKPHTVAGDIAAYYRFTRGDYGVTITDKMLSAYGITKEELHDIAVKNTTRTFPEPLPMEEIIGGIPGMELSPGEAPAMLVLTNEEACNGAGAIFCPHVLENAGRKMGGDFYIIPSSVHELLLVPAGIGDAEDMDWMVREVNATCVEPEIQLADHVFLYDSVRKKVTVPGEKTLQEKEPGKMNVKQEDSYQPHKRTGR